MATQTQQLASFYNEAIVFEADYNDVNGRVLGVRCRNNSPLLTAAATVANRVGASFSFQWAPLTTVTNNVPAAFGTVITDPSTGETVIALDATFGVVAH